jgi:hypothetical protein
LYGGVVPAFSGDDLVATEPLSNNQRFDDALFMDRPTGSPADAASAST